MRTLLQIKNAKRKEKMRLTFVIPSNHPENMENYIVFYVIFFEVIKKRLFDHHL